MPVSDRHFPSIWMIRFGLLMKRQFCRAGYWISLILALLFAALLMQMTAPGVSTDYGICNGGGEIAGKLTNQLMQETEDSWCIVYQDKKQMEKDLLAGRLDCAFVFDGRLDRGLEDGSLAGTIDYYRTSSTQQGEVLKEQIYSELYQYAARETLRSYAEDGRTFEGTSEEDCGFAKKREQIRESLLEEYDNYRKDPQIFQVNFIDEEDEQAVPDSEGTDTGRRNAAFCGMILFALALVYARVRFTAGHRRMMAAFDGRGRRCWRLCEAMASMLPAALTFGIFAACRPETDIGGLPAVLIFLLYGLLCSLWSILFAGLFRSESLYLFSLLSVLALTAVTCPVFTAYSSLTGALTLLRWVFPLQYLLLMI